MNRIAKLAIPAALALAAFGAQAQGFSPSAGGVYKGHTAQASAQASTSAERMTPFTPVAGGEFRGKAAPTRAGAEPTPQRAPTQGFLGA
jgi:hypothetical protein